MIVPKFNELNYDFFDEKDYEIYFIDECITLVKILSEAAWKSISKYTESQSIVTWDNNPLEDNDHAIFMASTTDGQVTILNFKDKSYTQSGKPISFYQWLKSYYQILPALISTGEKHNVLTLTIHSELPITEECYEDILEEDELFYESDRLMHCPLARQAALFPDATSEERLSVIQKHPFVICDLEDITFKELTLAFDTITEDGVKLSLVPFKQTTKDNQLLSIKDKAAFIKSTSENNMPDSIIFDIDNSLVFCFN
jgi:hypothetical protein